MEVAFSYQGCEFVIHYALCHEGTCQLVTRWVEWFCAA